METPYEHLVESSVASLKSDAAKRALAADNYWPKWDGPWWHMLLLHEMGHTALIPDSTVAIYIESLNRLAVKIFPIQPEDMPAGVDPYAGTACHCQVGTVYQVLTARGVAVDQALPWMRPWLSSYQMADGGHNCDNDAYLVKDECPSSMVGTIGIFEALVRSVPDPWSEREAQAVERAAQFLLRRQLRLGSETRHNAAERQSAEAWGQLCFPRFYFYDVLRGLSALAAWQQRTGAVIPGEAISEVVAHLTALAAPGPLRIGRVAYAGTKTRRRTPDGSWERADAGVSPLLAAVSAKGEASPYLERQWQATRRALRL